MRNNVYIRSNRSIMSISLTRIICILPMIIYGLYKNGVSLYINGYVDLFSMFRPFIFIIGSAFIGTLVNIIYEYLIKKSKDDLLSVMFSSFHIEYSILLACVMSINVNMLVYFGVLFILLFISKFLNNRVNIMCIIFILVYVISNYIESFSFLNIYESSKVFSLEFMDYLIGRSSGGIAATHTILLILALFGLYITNNNKTTITLSSGITYIILISILCIIKNISFPSILFNYNFLFVIGLIATDSVTSSYTPNGKIIYGVAVGILSFCFYFLNPVLAPFLAVLIVSLFNNLIDRKSDLLKIIKR